MTEKRTFREAVEEAHKVASRVFLTALASGETQGGAERKADVEFLKSLEAQGATILWGEPTEAMFEAVGIHTNNGKVLRKLELAAMRKAAPTVTDLMGDER